MRKSSFQFRSVLAPGAEAEAWKNIKAVIRGFLGKRRSENYQTAVQNMLIHFEELGVNMSLKIHFLHYHLNIIENQRATESDEQGERYHQVALPFEKRYKISFCPLKTILFLYIIFSDTKGKRNWILF